METTFLSQEATDSSKPSKVRKAVAVSALGIVLAGCANHDSSSAPELNKSAVTNSSAQETVPTCMVSDSTDGDFTVRAHFPESDSVKAPMITLTSDKTFTLGNFVDYDMRGDWTTVFTNQPSSNNVAIRKDGEFEMSFFNGNADLNVHAARLLLQGHGDAPVLCEVAD